MKALRVLPLALLLAACSSVNVPLSPYRIDVQQGNALEQESVEKLKLGLTRSQVRFLLGTPLLVDPFHSNRWDYVFNYRKAGKLAEERRLALFFDGDVLVRIEAEGMPAKGENPPAKPVEPANPVEKPAETAPEPAKSAIAAPVVAAPVPVAVTQPLPESAKLEPVAAVDAPKSAAPAEPRPAAEAAPVAVVEAPKPVVAAEPKPVAEPVLAAVPAAQVAEPSQRSLDETSIVPPLKSDQAKPTEAPGKPENLAEKAQEEVSLQTESNVEAIKPDVMPEFPNSPAMDTPEDQVMAAVNAWGKAWQARDEEAYLAAYAASFRPEGGISRAEWEKRRRLLLGLAHNIDLKIDGHALEMVGEDKAQVSFRQFYRSDSYQDAVIKQLKLVRVDNLWLIEEEKVLAPLKGKP